MNKLGDQHYSVELRERSVVSTQTRPGLPRRRGDAAARCGQGAPGGGSAGPPGGRWVASCLLGKEWDWGGQSGGNGGYSVRKRRRSVGKGGSGERIWEKDGKGAKAWGVRFLLFSPCGRPALFHVQSSHRLPAGGAVPRGSLLLCSGVLRRLPRWDPPGTGENRGLRVERRGGRGEAGTVPGALGGGQP